MTVPGITLEPCRALVLLRLRVNNICIPTQMPRNGRPESRPRRAPVLRARRHAASPCTHRTPRHPAARRRRRRRSTRRRRSAGRRLPRARVPSAPSGDCRCRSRAPQSTGRASQHALRRRHACRARRRAPRRAGVRARPLNVASMMWCTLRPRTSSTCSVMFAAVANDAHGVLGELRVERRIAERQTLRHSARPTRRTDDRTGRARRRRAPRRAGSGRWRTVARRPCRRAPRRTPHRSRWRRLRPCGACRSADRRPRCTRRSKPPWRPS